MDEKKAGSAGRGIKGYLNRVEELRHGDREESNGLAPGQSRCCTTLKPGEIIRIGDDIQINAYKKGGKIRIVIVAPRTMTIRWPHDKKD